MRLSAILADNVIVANRAIEGWFSLFSDWGGSKSL